MCFYIIIKNLLHKKRACIVGRLSDIFFVLVEAEKEIKLCL